MGTPRATKKSGTEPRAASAGTAGGWISSLRFSGFTLLIVGLLVIGALVVSPTLSSYVQQQRELAELRESVELHREAVAEVDAERLKWQDPAYVRSQARGRLFYVMPGEIQLSVIDDVIVPAESDEETSDQLTQINHNWARTLVASTLDAGTTSAEPSELLDRLLGVTVPENFGVMLNGSAGNATGVDGNEATESNEEDSE